MLNQHLTIPYDEIAAFCQRHHIRKLSLFGSVLREDFSEDSDVDVLVEFEPDAHVGLFGMGEIQMELTEMLGREVDLKTEGFLSRYFRQKVVDTAVTLYERR
jgi:predicted nucleotidyltransferase